MIGLLLKSAVSAHSSQTSLSASMASADIAMQNMQASHAHPDVADTNGNERPPAYQFWKPADAERDAAQGTPGQPDAIQDNAAADIEVGRPDGLKSDGHLRAGACCAGCSCPVNWLGYSIWFAIALGSGIYWVYLWYTMRRDMCEKTKRELFNVSYMVVVVSAAAFFLKWMDLILKQQYRGMRNRRLVKCEKIVFRLLTGAAVVMLVWAGPSLVTQDGHRGPCNLPDGVSVLRDYSDTNDWPWDVYNTTVKFTNGTTNTTAFIFEGPERH